MEESYQEPTYPQPEPTPTEPKKSRFRLRKFKPSRKHSGFLMFVAVIAVIGLGAYVYQRQVAVPDPNNVLGANAEQQQKENEDILKKVGELTLVPLNETPEVAEIADTTKLDGQVFFSRAQNGDRVIIYRNAKRVILYRPSTNMIIETGPLTEPSVSPEAPAQPEAEQIPQ